MDLVDYALRERDLDLRMRRWMEYGSQREEAPESQDEPLVRESSPEY